MAAVKSTHLYGGGNTTEWTDIINQFISSSWSWACPWIRRRRRRTRTATRSSTRERLGSVDLARWSWQCSLAAQYCLLTNSHRRGGSGGITLVFFAWWQMHARATQRRCV